MALRDAFRGCLSNVVCNCTGDEHSASRSDDGRPHDALVEEVQPPRRTGISCLVHAVFVFAVDVDCRVRYCLCSVGTCWRRRRRHILDDVDISRVATSVGGTGAVVPLDDFAHDFVRAYGSSPTDLLSVCDEKFDTVEREADKDQQGDASEKQQQGPSLVWLQGRARARARATNANTRTRGHRASKSAQYNNGKTPCSGAPERAQLSTATEEDWTRFTLTQISRRRKKRASQ